MAFFTRASAYVSSKLRSFSNGYNPYGRQQQQQYQYQQQQQAPPPPRMKPISKLSYAAPFLFFSGVSYLQYTERERLPTSIRDANSMDMDIKTAAYRVLAIKSLDAPTRKLMLDQGAFGLALNGIQSLDPSLSGCSVLMLRTFCQREDLAIKAVQSGAVKYLLDMVMAAPSNVLRCQAANTLLVLAKHPSTREALSDASAISTFMRMTSIENAPWKLFEDGARCLAYLAENQKLHPVLIAAGVGSAFNVEKIKNDQSLNHNTHFPFLSFIGFPDLTDVVKAADYLIFGPNKSSSAPSDDSPMVLVETEQKRPSYFPSKSSSAAPQKSISKIQEEYEHSAAIHRIWMGSSIAVFYATLRSAIAQRKMHPTFWKSLYAGTNAGFPALFSLFAFQYFQYWIAKRDVNEFKTKLYLSSDDIFMNKVQSNMAQAIVLTTAVLVGRYVYFPLIAHSMLGPFLYPYG